MLSDGQSKEEHGLNEQPQRSLPGVGQANLYILFVLLLLISMSRMQHRSGPLGVVATQAIVFGALPLALAYFGGVRPLAAAFRLRLISWEAVLRSLFLTVLAWIVAQAVNVVVTVLITRLGGVPQNPYERLFTPGYPTWLLLTVMALLPGLCEEWAFRGFVLSGYSRVGPKAGWVLTGLMFAAIHGSLFRLPSLAVLGLTFSYVALRSGSILPSIIMHLSGNALAILLALKGGLPEVQSGGPIPWAAALWWVMVGAGVLPLLIAVARGFAAEAPRIGGAADAPAQPPDDEPWQALFTWLPLLPAALLLGMLFWSDLLHTLNPAP